MIKIILTIIIVISLLALLFISLYTKILVSKTRVLKAEKEIEDELNKRYNAKIETTIQTIEIIRNDYPKLDKKKDFKELVTKLEESTTYINAAKSYFNSYNKNLLTYSRKFPTNIMCLIMKIKKKPYYEGKDVFSDIDI